MQKFSKGKYILSFLAKAKRGTRLCLLYDLFKDGHWEVVPLTFFLAPDSRIYRIEKTFSISDLSDNDFFLVGAWVQDGEAFLDNFSLRQLPD